MLLEKSFRNSYVNNGSRWLIPGVLPANSLAMISGRAGSGKSFLMVDILSSMAGFRETVLGPIGRCVNGYAVHVCLESPGEMFKRYVATNELAMDYGMEVLGVSDFDLTDREACASFAHEIKKITHGGPDAIGWSTFNRLAPGVDENSTADMTMVWNNLDLIRRITGATQIVEHHTALGSDRPRGSSVTDGVLHTIINVSASRGGLRVACTKQRTAPPFEPISARVVDVPSPTIEGVVLGPTVPRLERVVKAPVVAVGASGPAGCASAPKKSLTQERVGSVQEVMGFAHANGMVSWSEMEPLKLMAKATFYRAVKTLESSGMLLNVGNGVFKSTDDV